MKKITTLACAVSLLSLIGCSQMPTQIEDGSKNQIDKEPLIVGLPFSERVATTSKNIDNQLDLLHKVKSQEHVGAFEMVKHNNDLDARLDSDKTIPKAYKDVVAKQQAEIANNETKEVSKSDNIEEIKDVAENLMNRKLKALDWENNSFKELVKMFAQALGYEFIDNKNIKDFNITLKASNITIANALQELKKKSEKVNIVVAEKTKTITITNK
jgi:hypothetical protein